MLESAIYDVHERLALRVRPEEVGASNAEAFKALCDERFDHGGTLGRYLQPTPILQTENDGIVDISHAERNAAAARQGTFIRFERGNHNTILAVNSAAYLRALTQFLLGLVASMAPAV